jgi:hypothetical protein
VQPKGLLPGRHYSVMSFNSGKTETFGGKGIEVNLPEMETSEILQFRGV